MVNGNGNSRWQLAFWVITAICGIWLVCLTNGVIANDRIRANEDKSIIYTSSTQYSEIIQRLVRIETKIENNHSNNL